MDMYSKHKNIILCVFADFRWQNVWAGKRLSGFTMSDGAGNLRGCPQHLQSALEQLKWGKSKQPDLTVGISNPSVSLCLTECWRSWVLLHPWLLINWNGLSYFSAPQLHGLELLLACLVCLFRSSCLFLHNFCRAFFPAQARRWTNHYRWKQWV